TIGVDFGRRVPWTTIPKHLVASSHVLKGWPVDVPFPHKTIKAEKAKKANGMDGSQGIKDLDHKNAQILQNALIIGAITLKKIDNPQLILNNTIPIISTSLPNSGDCPGLSTCDLFANSKIKYHAEHVTSTAATRVKRCKAVTNTKAFKHDVISVGSESTSGSVLSSRPVVEVISDSNNDRPVLELHKHHKVSQSIIIEDIPSDDDYSCSQDDNESESSASRMKAKGKGKSKEKGKEKEKVPACTALASRLAHGTSKTAWSVGEESRYMEVTRVEHVRSVPQEYGIVRIRTKELYSWRIWIGFRRLDIPQSFIHRLRYV
ncbi:hypothetical protein C0993_006831, partial [Termitomyces sp. T159_Od127]